MALASPPNGEDVRKVVEERMAALGDGLQETVTVEWRNQQKTLPVISMPVDLVSYNPSTHRIRAQRTLDPARDHVLDTDPFSAEAQAYLHSLLMGTPADPSKRDPSFDLLKKDLLEHGQSDPGIITRHGVLINGNTRRAALKELGREHIRVGVLPPDAGHDDLQSIELSLQLRKDHRRDYSFMNLLLAIDERVEAGRPPSDIQRDFRIQAKTFEKYRWILSFVREALERSKVTGTNGEQLSMRLVDFESDQGQLEELYRSYKTLKAKSPDEAESMVEQRLLAMILDKSKTDLRLIEPDFAERFMKIEISHPHAGSSVGVKIPGTAITAAPPSQKVEALKAITTSVLQAKAVELSPNSASPEVLSKANSTLAKFDRELDAALDKAGKNSRITKKRYAAVDRISDANEDLELAVGAVAEARATGNFDTDDLDEALLALKASIARLAQVVSRGATENGLPPGVAWLRSAASVSEDT